MGRTKRIRVTGLGNHPKGWEPTGRDVPVNAPGLAELQEAAKVNATKPSQADMRAAFGEPIDEGRQVRWSLDMGDRKTRAKYNELMREHRRALKERNRKFNGRPKIELQNRETGERRLVFEEVAETVGRKGNMHEPGGFRGTPVVRGPGGMLFKRLGPGNWWPTGRKCLGTPLDDSDPYDLPQPQYDPDGGLWLRDDDGSWRSAEQLLEEVG